MKVAMIVNSFPALSEKYLINQFIGLLNHGIDIDIYAAVASLDKMTHDIFHQYNIENRTFNLNIPRKAWKRIFHLPLLFIKNLIRNPCYTIRSFCSKKYSIAALNLKNLYFLNALYKKKYDIIHCQFGQNGLIGSFLKDCHICNHFIVTFHGSDITKTPKNYSKSMYNYMFKRADKITVGSNFIKNILIQYGCGKDRIQIIPMGIIKNNYNKTEPGNYILSIGRLVEVKGFSYAIEAFSCLADSFPNINYYIIGDGPLYTSLEESIKLLNLDKRIFLMGAKKDTDVEDFYKNAIVLIMPSIRTSDGSEEGQGLVVQEAGSYGLPVIGTATGGITDGILDTETGFLVPEKNSTALGEKISFLLRNPEIGMKMGKAARQFVHDNYDIDILSEKLINTVYNSCSDRV